MRHRFVYIAAVLAGTAAVLAPGVAAAAERADGAAESRPEPARTTRGKLSFYGRQLAGRPTASGEPFDPEALTMAHDALPFGTKVRVTDLRTGRNVVVRVNDRGPVTPGRIGDVSLAAARRLGMIRRGVIQARLEVLADAGQEPGSNETRPATRSP